MKTQIAIAAVVVGLFAFALPGFVAAQGNVPQFRGFSDSPNGPTVSPYLNLLQSNQFGITNYQSLVRPLVDQREESIKQATSLQRLQQQVREGQASGNRQFPGGVRGTGHDTRFLNFSHYYSYPQRH